MTHRTDFLDLEFLICSTLYAIELAEAAVDSIIADNTVESNAASYAVGKAREEARNLHAAFYAGVRANRGEAA